MVGIGPRIERIEKVWSPKAISHILNKDKEIDFAYPPFGPNTYRSVGNEILNNGLELPNGESTASLLHSAYCYPEVENEPEFKYIKGIMNKRYLWDYDLNLWTPKGLYIVQDLKAEGLSRKLEIGELEKMLKGGKDIHNIRFSKNGIVRFAPKGTYKLGEHTSESLSKDGSIIARCGEYGAEKYGEVSAKFERKPHIYGVETEDQPVQRVSAVGGYIGGGRLGFYGDFGDYGDGHAFGVHK